MSISTRQADLAFELADSGVPVTLGAASTHGQVRHGGSQIFEDQEGHELSTPVHSVLVARDSLPGLAINAVIVADGVSYTVRDFLPESDGMLIRIICVKAA